MRAGRFVIRTEHGGTKVSWSVTGVRHDAFAREHPFRAEQPKVGTERGRYLHPDLYGKPSSASVIRPLAGQPRSDARVERLLRCVAMRADQQDVVVAVRGRHDRGRG